MVGDGHAMGVAAQVAKNLSGPVKGGLGINYPVLAVEATQPSAKLLLISQSGAGSRATEFLLAVKAFQTSDELPAEDPAQHLNGQKEGVAWVHPASSIRRDPSCRDDTVDVGVGQQVLAPGVENAEDANLRAQMLGIGGNGEQSGGAGREQQMVKQTGVLQGQQVELVRDSEDDVKVVGGQKFPLPGCQPAFTSLSLLGNSGCGTSCRKWP